MVGILQTNTSISYIPENAWIISRTVRENILLGSSFNQEKYETIIGACALKSDLANMINGDETVIGESGFTLSGGQKQRIALARAIYKEADIYLLDDPLSSLDAHVAQHIFENIIGPNGLLHNKTRLLVTHHVEFLPKCHRVCCLINGTIANVGMLIHVHVCPCTLCRFMLLVFFLYFINCI